MLYWYYCNPPDPYLNFTFHQRPFFPLDNEKTLYMGTKVIFS